MRGGYTRCPRISPDIERLHHHRCWDFVKEREKNREEETSEIKIKKREK